MKTDISLLNIFRDFHQAKEQDILSKLVRACVM